MCVVSVWRRCRPSQVQVADGSGVAARLAGAAVQQQRFHFAEAQKYRNLVRAATV